MFLLVRYIEVTQRHILHKIISANDVHSNLPSEIPFRTEWSFPCSGPWNRSFCCIITSSFVPSSFIRLQFSVTKHKVLPNAPVSSDALKQHSYAPLPNCIHSDIRNAASAAWKLYWSDTGRGSKRLITTTKFKINTVKSL